MDREPSACSVIKVSRKGIAPFPYVPSIVNLIAQEILSSGLFLNDPGVIHKPIPYPGGFAADFNAFPSKYSMYRLATMGLMGDPTATPSTCSEFILKGEVSIV